LTSDNLTSESKFFVLFENLKKLLRSRCSSVRASSCGAAPLALRLFHALRDVGGLDGEEGSPDAPCHAGTLQRLKPVLSRGTVDVAAATRING
jgi:hypothetical protein